MSSIDYIHGRRCNSLSRKSGYSQIFSSNIFTYIALLLWKVPVVDTAFLNSQLVLLALHPLHLAYLKLLASRTKLNMSRHSGSSRHRSHQPRSSETNSEDTVEQAKAVVNQLNTVLTSAPHQWETYLPSARSAMSALDHVRFFRDSHRYNEQIWILHGLQDFAFHDPDRGAIRDVAEWCQAAWLRILRNYPEDVETLTGTPQQLLEEAIWLLFRKFGSNFQFEQFALARCFLKH